MLKDAMKNVPVHVQTFEEDDGACFVIVRIL